MDAATAQMVADLGLARRNEVSAPDADSKGRAVNVDPREQAATQAEVQRRQAKASAPAAAGENEVSARLRAWNSMFSFIYQPLSNIADLFHS